MPIFGKKTEKKMEEIEEEKYYKERRERTAERNVLLDVTTFEEEKGKFEKNRFKLISEKRELSLENKTDSPIFSIEVFLEDKGFTDIDRDKLFIPMLAPYGKENSRRAFEYHVDKKKYKPVILAETNNVFPEEVTTPVLLYGKENFITHEILLKNNDGVNIGLVYRIHGGNYLKGVEILEGVAGSIEKEDVEGETVYRFKVRDFVGEKKIRLRLNVVPANSEPIGVGTSVAQVVTDMPLSRLKIKDVIMKTRLVHTVKKNERKDQPGIWDIELVIENPNNFKVYVNGEMIPEEGEILEDQSEISLLGASIEDGKVILKDVEVRPKDRVRVTPIVLKSKTYPVFNINLRGEIKETVSVKSKAIYEIVPEEYPVLRGEISKNIELQVEEAYRELVEENEMPSIGESCVLINSSFKNIGSSEIGYVKIIEAIPPGLSNPKNLKVFLNGEELSKATYNMTVEPENPAPGVPRKFILEIPNLDAVKAKMKKDDEIKLTYQLCSEVPTAGTFELPTNVVFSTDEKNIKLEDRTPDEVTPRIKVRPIVRSIEVTQDVIPLEETDVYKVILKLRNTSDITIRKYRIYDIVPPSFKILTTEPEGKVETRENGNKITWTIDELEPEKEIVLEYTVRGEGEYRVEDLIGIEGI